MAHEYSNPKRETDPYALPNVEVFYAKAGELWQNDGNGMEGYDEPNEPGYYWQACFPGCLPDGDPIGPFATYAEALEDARDGVNDDDE